MSTQISNGTTVPHATSYLDLLAKLRTFLTTDSTLTGLGQNWTELATNSTPYTTGNDTVDFETYLKAPGLSGTESIYVNIRAYHNTSSDYWNWEQRGAQGYSNVNSFTSQYGTSPGTFTYLWNSTIPYWFIANGQRAIVIAKISTVYECIYMGKFLPYGTPSQYPYPLSVGGSGYDMDRRYSDNTAAHLAFFDPVNLQVCRVDGSWEMFQNYGNGGNQLSACNVWPTMYSGSNRPTWVAANLDGSYPIFPMALRETSAGNMLGEFDGVGWTTGYSNSAESTINDCTNSWLVVPNAFRSAADFFAAIKLV